MYQLITDACCDVPADVLNKLNVAYIPMTLDLDGKQYDDDLGQTFDYQWFLECLKENKQPTTSQINVGQYLSYFKPYAQQQIPLLYVAFSSGLSGSFSSALQAVEIVKEDYPLAEIYCVDTKGASLGEGMLVIQAAAMQQANHSLQEVVAWLETYKDHVRSWVTVDDLGHLERGGRISKTTAAIGGLLNIKPIIHVDTEGKLQTIGKARGRMKALKTILDATEKEFDPAILNQLYLAHSGDEESVSYVLEQLAQRLPDTPVEHFPLGPTIASHTGYGCIALFSMGKTAR